MSNIHMGAGIGIGGISTFVIERLLEKPNGEYIVAILAIGGMLFGWLGTRTPGRRKR